MIDEGKRRAQKTYNAAADHFEDPALGFWDRYGHATVERLGLHRGATVLDVCAGAGGSALPAAVRVAPTGRVLAVDLALDEYPRAVFVPSFGREDLDIPWETGPTTATSYVHVREVRIVRDEVAGGIQLADGHI